MKIHYVSHALFTALISLMAFSAYAATGTEKPALSAVDVKTISERIRNTGDQVRADLKKARARFEAQEAARKVEAERAHQQAINDAAQRKAQQAAEAHERQVAAQAQAERVRLEAEQAKQQAERTERKKQLILAAQDSKESQATSLQARKQMAAEALKKARASTGVKAFGE